MFISVQFFKSYWYSSLSPSVLSEVMCGCAQSQSENKHLFIKKKKKTLNIHNIHMKKGIKEIGPVGSFVSWSLKYSLDRRLKKENKMLWEGGAGLERGGALAVMSQQQLVIFSLRGRGQGRGRAAIGAQR